MYGRHVVTEQSLRRDWCVQGEEAGFSPAEAARLAFWRWQAQRRGETSDRAVPEWPPWKAPAEDRLGRWLGWR